jgi:hypothetical protein
MIGVEETAYGRAIIQPHLPGDRLGLGLGELCRVAGGV